MAKKAIKTKKKLKTKADKKIKIGVVTSRFNHEVTEMLLDGALRMLEEAQVEIYSVKVPGAIEIPLACQALIKNAGCEGVVALGSIIRGETSHYDVVCMSVERALTQLMLDTGKPIGFGVLTTENEEQAFDRVGGNHGHKGEETALTTLEMVGLLRDLNKIGK